MFASLVASKWRWKENEAAAHDLIMCELASVPV